jgi:hypothetical protein
MRFLLCSAPTLGSQLIRTLTWSEWSHVAIPINDHQVVEAVWPRVQISTIDEVLAKHPDYQFVDLPVPRPDLAIAAALSQVGKRYDWKALFGFLFHRDWADPGQWFCSELATWCAMQGEAQWFRAEVLDRITPDDVWKLAPIDSKLVTGMN